MIFAHQYNPTKANFKKIWIFAPQIRIMKQFVISAVIAVLLVGCAGNGNEALRVEGQVKGLKKGTLYLQQVQDTVLVTLDSVAIGPEGSFELNAQIEEPDLFYVYLSKADNNDLNDRIAFFAEPGLINIQTRWNAFDSDAEITGSELHEKFQEYRNNQSRFHVQELEVAQTMSGLSLPEDQSKMDSLETVLNRVGLRSYLYSLNFALNNRDSQLAPFIACTEVADANPKYLDSIYNVLSPEVAASKYGKRLKEILKK